MRIRTFILASLVASGFTAFAQNASSANATHESTFASVGLGSTETAQINVTNIALPPATTGGSSSAASPACTGTVSFLNAGGTTIGKAGTFSVTPGQTSSTPLPFSTSNITGIRGQVRGVVQVNTIVNGVFQSCSLALSFEIFDSVTGASHVVLTSTAAAASVVPVIQFGR